MRCEDLDAGLLSDDLQLADRAGTLQVARDEQRCMSLPAKPFGELPGECRLTGALQTGEHHHGGRVLGEGQLTGLAAEDADQFLVDDLDDLLGRVQRRGHLGAFGALLDAGDEVAHDGQRHVGFEQSESDLAGGGVDVLVGQPALAAQPGEDTGQPVGQGFKHAASLKVVVNQCLRRSIDSAL